MIVDVGLNNIAGLLNGESISVPSYGLVSSDELIVDSTDTSLSGELDRHLASGSRTLNTTTFSFTRSGATASSDGDYINSAGLLTASTGGDLYAEATISSLLHTTAFDLEFEWSVTIDRR